MKKQRIFGLLFVVAMFSLSCMLFACGPAGGTVSVSLDKTTLAMTVNGEDATLTATVTGTDNKAVTWKVTDANPEGCVTVNSGGKVQAVAAGTAKVVATSQEDSTKSAECAVTVSFVNVTGVTLDQSTLALKVGGASGKLTATIAPANASDKRINWSAETLTGGEVPEDDEDADPVVVTVSGGTIYAVAAGTAKITAKSDQDGTKFAECTVTVTFVKATGLTLNKETITLSTMAGGTESETLIATVSPDDASNKKVNWRSGNAKIARVSDTGVVSAVGTGTTTITATSDDDSQFSDTCEVSVTTDPVTSFALTLGNLSIAVNGNPRTLGVLIEPATASKSVIWSVISASPAGCVTIDEFTGEMRGIEVGTATVKATSASDESFFDTADITVVAEGTSTAIGISTVEEFMTTRYITDENYYLLNDLDFTGKADLFKPLREVYDANGVQIDKNVPVWTVSHNDSMGDTAHYHAACAAGKEMYKTGTFSGTFDGRGFALKNFKIREANLDLYYGCNKYGPIADFEHSLFGNISEEGIVKNLAVIGAEIVTIGQNAFIATFNSGTIENIYLENCTISCTQSFSDPMCSGGVIAWRNEEAEIDKETEEITKKAGVIKNVVMNGVGGMDADWAKHNYLFAMVNGAPAENVQNIFAYQNGGRVDGNLYWINEFILERLDGGVNNNLTKEGNNAYFLDADALDVVDGSVVDFSALDENFWDLSGTWPKLIKLDA